MYNVFKSTGVHGRELIACAEDRREAIEAIELWAFRTGHEVICIEEDLIEDGVDAFVTGPGNMDSYVIYTVKEPVEA